MPFALESLDRIVSDVVGITLGRGTTGEAEGGYQEKGRG